MYTAIIETEYDICERRFSRRVDAENFLDCACAVGNHVLQCQLWYNGQLEYTF